MKIKKSVLPFVMVLMMVGLSACGTASSAASVNQQNSNAAQVTAIPTSVPAATTVPQSTSSSIVVPSTLGGYEAALEAVYEKVNPSVVNIQVTSTTQASNGNSTFPDTGIPGFHFYFGTPGDPNQQQSPQVSQALGSGFIWDTQGHIVTNNHVVEGADKIQVKFYDGTIVPATLVGTDASSDLAVIKLENHSGDLLPVTMASSSAVKVGQTAIAIGNPYGLENTMTVGIVSAVGRSLSTDLNSSSATFSIPDIIQTDAPINPGNSGGVLLNSSGDLIGVTSAIESSSGSNAGIGFAIPSDMVAKVIPALISNGKYEHSYLGLTGTTLTPALAEAMNADTSLRGVLVISVNANGPADKAGLLGSSKTVTIDGQQTKVGGDIITAIDGTSLTSMDDLISYLANNTTVGQKVTLTVNREGQQKSLDATLIARPASVDASNNTTTEAQAPGNESQGAWLGVSAQNMSADIAKEMGLPEDQKGVLVVEVEAGSPADEAGIRGGYKPAIINSKRVMVGGDVIVAMAGKDIATTDDLKSTIAGLKPGEQVTVTVVRDGKDQDLQLTLGTN